MSTNKPIQKSSIDRREFLKVTGAAGITLALGTGLKAQASETPDPDSPEFKGMLIDTTMCIGCRACEQACNETNQLPKPEVDFSDTDVLEKFRDTTPNAYKVVNKYNNPTEPDKPIFVPKQCLHCNQPACASACLTKALEKTKDGPVIYNQGRCMGCRYCMVACPVEIPRFEYNSPAPYIQKCIFCYEKLKKGEAPACASTCPTGATKFGTRRELLEEARQRVYSNPKKYHNHIYGENEIGGTGVMYLSSVPFEKIGFKTNLGSKPYPQLTQGFLTAVPLVFVLWPSLLYGLNAVSKDKNKDNQHDDSHKKQESKHE